MTANFLWGAAGSAYNLLTTELNSLADGSGTAVGPEIDNTTNAFQFGRLHVHIASNSSAFTGASYVSVFFLPSNAGASYPTYTSGSSYKLAEANYLVGSIMINPATQSSNVVEEWLESVRIPLGKFKAVLVNHTGATLPASGNTLDIIPTPTQY